MEQEMNPIEKSLVDGLVGNEETSTDVVGEGVAESDVVSDTPTDAPADTPVDAPEDAAPPDNQAGSESTPEASEDTQDGFKPNPWWDTLKSKLSASDSPYELPEHLQKGLDRNGNPLTPEAEFEELVDTIAKNIEIEESDPFIAMYKAEKAKEDFNYDDFVKKYKAETDIINLPSKEFMAEYLKMDSEQNKRGWTEDDISEYINSKNKIELDTLAAQAKGNMQNMLTAKAKQEHDLNIQQGSKQAQQKVEDYNKTIDNRVGTLVNEMSKLSKIGGIPHGQAEIDEFLPIFKEQVKLNPATGAPKIRDVFNDDKTLYKTLYLLHKMEQGAFTDINEKAKQEVLQKTGLQKRGEGGTGKTVKVPESSDFVI